ncbi:hypothetical protein MASR1M101_12730 [Gemmatimonas sp.]
MIQFGRVASVSQGTRLPPWRDSGRCALNADYVTCDSLLQLPNLALLQANATKINVANAGRSL